MIPSPTEDWKHIMIVITGATGQLGRLVIASLRSKVPAAQIVAAVRAPERAADLAALGVQVRKADTTSPRRSTPPCKARPSCC